MRHRRTDSEDSRSSDGLSETESHLSEQAGGDMAYQYLKVKSYSPARGGNRDGPICDVVHVTVSCPDDELLGIDSLHMRSDRSTKRRELVFRFDMAKFLLGDLTYESVKQLARAFLDDVLAVWKPDDPTRKRTMLIVAYDLGSLVVKSAISLAAKSEESYPGIFSSVSRIVFSECPQRGLSVRNLEAKLCSYFGDKMDGSSWADLLSADSVHRLARAALETTQQFVSSKITLRSRVISIFPAKPGVDGASPFDSYTATIGVPTEVILPDFRKKKTNEKFEALHTHMTYKAEGLITHPDWLPVERTLLSLAAPHQQIYCQPKPLLSLPPSLLTNSLFQEWRDSLGPAALYLQGDGGSHSATRDLADQIFLWWQALPRRYGADRGYQAKVFSFTFSAADPSRKSLSGMLAALSLALVSHNTNDVAAEHCALVRDWLQLQLDWTDKSCIGLLEAARLLITGRDTLFLLHDFDECDRDSQKAFVELLHLLEKRCECPFKILLTARIGCGADLFERKWAATIDTIKLKLDGSSTEAETGHDENQSTSKSIGIIDQLTRDCPDVPEAARIRSALGKLDCSTLSNTVDLLQSYSGWPEDRSRRSLARFADACELVSPEDNTYQALGKIMLHAATNDGVDELRWALKWIIHGFRPMTFQELAEALLLRRRQNTQVETDMLPAATSRGMIDETCRRLQFILRVLIEPDNDRIVLRQSIRLILDVLELDSGRLRSSEPSAELFASVMEIPAHQDLAAFCLSVVTCAEAEARLYSLLQRNLRHPQQRDSVPALDDDYEDFFLYAVQALPYHLKHCRESNFISEAVLPSLTGNTGERMRAWAQAHWAMSKASFRSEAQPEHAGSVLVGHGILSEDQVQQIIAIEKNRWKTAAVCGEYVVAAARGRRLALLQGLLLPELETAAATAAAEIDHLYDQSVNIWTESKVLVDALDVAIRAGGEDVALVVARRLFEIGCGATACPSSMLRAAAWFDMSKLTSVLLQNGVKPIALSPWANNDDDQDVQNHNTSDRGEAQPEVGMGTEKVEDAGRGKEKGKEGGEREEMKSTESSAPGSNFPVPSPLAVAASLGHVRTVKALLNYSAPPDCSAAETSSAFLIAVEKGQEGVVLAMLDHNADLLNFKQPDQDPPLYVAAGRGNFSLVSTLIDKGLQPDSDSCRRSDEDNKWPPLAIAASLGYVATTRVLLERGNTDAANIMVGNDMDTPLYSAAVQGQSLACVRLLLEHGADPNHKLLDPPLANDLAMITLAKDEEAVSEASKSEDSKEKDSAGGDGWYADTNNVLAICDVLIANNPPMLLSAKDVESGRTALMEACQAGPWQRPMIKWLLDHGANVNDLDDDRRNALYYAVENGYVSIAKELLARQLDSNKMDEALGSQITHLAARMEDSTIMKLLIEAGVNVDQPDESGDRPLNKASMNGRLDQVKLLIATGKVDVNHKDHWGWAPAFDAVAYADHVAMLRELAEAGADLRCTVGSGSGGWTLVHYAMHKKDPDLLKVLLEFREFIDLDHIGDDGQTPFVAAAANPNSNMDCLKLLLRAGADPNSQDKKGLGPLHLALRTNRTELLTLLLAHPRVNLNLLSRSWGTPLQEACRLTNLEHVKLLLHRGVDVQISVSGVYRTTPLIAALVSIPPVADEATLTRMDQIARELVRRGADVNAQAKGSLLSPIAAACLGSGKDTIAFLLDVGASASNPNIVSGRIPLHLAAAGGLANFQAVLPYSDGDLMAEDLRGKTALHWAAQFGNAEVVEHILSRAAAATSRSRAGDVDKRDHDDWTALCWAVRPFANQRVGGDGEGPHNRDVAATVRTLLRYKADRTVKFRISKTLKPKEGEEQEKDDKPGGSDFEELTPLIMAMRCDLSDEVLNMLRYGPEGKKDSKDNSAGSPEEDPPLQRKYVFQNHTCDFCYASMFGSVFHCQTCADFDVCRKCLTSVPKFHTPAIMGDDGDNDKKHEFLELTSVEEFAGESADAPPPQEQDTDSEGASAVGDAGAAATGGGSAAADDAVGATEGREREVSPTDDIALSDLSGDDLLDVDDL